VLHSVLLFDILIHLNQVLLPFLLLVLLHELFEHLFCRLLALLANVLFDQFVYTAHLLLFGDSLSA